MQRPKAHKSRQRGGDREILARAHFRAMPQLEALWTAFDATELPKLESCRAMFPNRPDIQREIAAIGKTCFQKPPIAVEFDRHFGFNHDDDWIVHLGRLRHNDAKSNQIPLFWIVKELFGDDARLSGFFYYPPGGFKEWHTDFEDAVVEEEKRWRIYLVKTTEDRKSWFQYLDPYTQKIKRIYDQNGYLNMFHLPESPPLWHGVYSNTHRWSLGIKMGEEAVKALLDCPGLEGLAA